MAARLDAQLDSAVKRFLGDRNRNRFDPVSGRLEISPIFDWYKTDFDKARDGGSVAQLDTALREVDGFDPELRLGEDVDLVWRLDAAGWRCRYEPSVSVFHSSQSSSPSRSLLSVERSSHLRRAALPTGSATLRVPLNMREKNSSAVWPVTSSTPMRSTAMKTTDEPAGDSQARSGPPMAAPTAD